MTLGCRMTIRREGDHPDNHKLNGNGGFSRHWRFIYTIKNNACMYAIAGKAPLQTENITTTISTMGKSIDVSSNNPGIGRPDVTFDGNTVSFSEGDEYTWDSTYYKFRVKRENDGEDFKEFTATILPK